jgi:hypothetical protein
VPVGTGPEMPKTSCSVLCGPSSSSNGVISGENLIHGGAVCDIDANAYISAYDIWTTSPAWTASWTSLDRLLGSTCTAKAGSLGSGTWPDMVTGWVFGGA